MIRLIFFFLEHPNLQDIQQDFTQDMFTVEDIKSLGTPLVTDTYIKSYVTQNCLKIITDVEKHDPLTDGFVHNHLMKFCMNTRTEYMIATITLPPQDHFLLTQHLHVDTVIVNAILQKGTRGSFRQWDKSDYDLSVTMLQKTHALGGHGMTSNTITQTSVKVVMSGDLYPLPSVEQNL